MVDGNVEQARGRAASVSAPVDAIVANGNDRRSWDDSAYRERLCWMALTDATLAGQCLYRSTTRLLKEEAIKPSPS